MVEKSKNQIRQNQIFGKLHGFCYLNTYLYRLSQSKYFNFYLNQTNYRVNIRFDDKYRAD